MSCLLLTFPSGEDHLLHRLILFHAFISFRIDFGNYIYSVLGSVYLAKLQSIIKGSSRMFGGDPKFGHISTYIRDTLHWLPIIQSIEFKILAFMRNYLAGIVPSYLGSLCITASSVPGCRSLLSADQGVLLLPSDSLLDNSAQKLCLRQSCGLEQPSS